MLGVRYNGKGRGAQNADTDAFCDYLLESARVAEEFCQLVVNVETEIWKLHRRYEALSPRLGKEPTAAALDRLINLLREIHPGTLVNSSGGVSDPKLEFGTDHQGKAPDDLTVEGRTVDDEPKGFPRLVDRIAREIKQPGIRVTNRERNTVANGKHRHESSSPVDDGFPPYSGNCLIPSQSTGEESPGIVPKEGA